MRKQPPFHVRDQKPQIHMFADLYDEQSRGLGSIRYALLKDNFDDIIEFEELSGLNWHLHSGIDAVFRRVV